MTLKRRYFVARARPQLLSAACPGIKGFRMVGFPLARVTFSFAGHEWIPATVTRDCKVRG
ncbi:MAG TPA: hypothetical protein VND98_11950 [Solirubrobacterales bacterium]|nr:hypothetical protein [Solirubrobacterales bacterium]